MKFVIIAFLILALVCTIEIVRLVEIILAFIDGIRIELLEEEENAENRKD